MKRKGRHRISSIFPITTVKSFGFGRFIIRDLMQFIYICNKLVMVTRDSGPVQFVTFDMISSQTLIITIIICCDELLRTIFRNKSIHQSIYPPTQDEKKKKNEDMKIEEKVRNEKRQNQKSFKTCMNERKDSRLPSNKSSF